MGAGSAAQSHAPVGLNDGLTAAVVNFIRYIRGSLGLLLRARKISWALGRASLPLHRSRQTEELARRSPAFIRRGVIEGFRDGVGSAGRSGSLSVLVDLALRQLREGLVSLLFFGERRFQQLYSLI